jgi:hypothetical protein
LGEVAVSAAGEGFEIHVYLKEGFDSADSTGDETVFETKNIVPAQGLALFFTHHLAHKGQPVLEGRKYVLRTDVMYR